MHTLLSQILLVTVGAVSYAAASDEVLALPPLGRKVAIDRDFTHKPIPRWQNGFLLAPEEAFQPIVFVFDSSGKKLRDMRVSIPDASNVQIIDAAIQPDGKTAISGSAVSGSTPATFIAWYDRNGALERVVRTYPFSPRSNRRPSLLAIKNRASRS